MRPTTTSATTTALSALIAALPIERLDALVLEIANGSAATPTETVNTPDDPKPATREHRGGWPRGRRRGPRKATGKAAATAKKAEARATRNARRNESKRAKRAVARAQREAVQQAETVTPANGISRHGNGNHGGKKAEAARLWEHAAKMDAKSPWRVVANEFDLNKQQTLDAFRQHTLPPGVTADAIERFLELPIS